MPWWLNTSYASKVMDLMDFKLDRFRLLQIAGKVAIYVYSHRITHCFSCIGDSASLLCIFVDAFVHFPAL